MVTVEKVIAYITHGDRLLVFEHVDFPEAGIQVPAGTVEAGESPEAAVLREVFEETGLDGLRVRARLGARHRHFPHLGPSAHHLWHFFHLTLTGDAPGRWRHFEDHPSDGSTEPIEFELYWVRYPDAVPVLAGGQGELLHLLAPIS